MGTINNNGETTGVQQEKKITGLDSDNESTGVKSELVNTGATYKVDYMALIEEAIVEAEQVTAEGCCCKWN